MAQQAGKNHEVMEEDSVYALPSSFGEEDQDLGLPCFVSAECTPLLYAPPSADSLPRRMVRDFPGPASRVATWTLLVASLVPRLR